MPSVVALIPARSGSERVPDKNIRPLAGHPLLAYAIATAHHAGVFDRVVCSTDSGKIGEVAQHFRDFIQLIETLKNFVAAIGRGFGVGIRL